jgi:hypothetical protein
LGEKVSDVIAGDWKKVATGGSAGATGTAAERDRTEPPRTRPSGARKVLMADKRDVLTLGKNVPPPAGRHVRKSSVGAADQKSFRMRM